MNRATEFRFYVQTINDLVKETEKIGETMNPNYEEIRQAR